MGFLIEDGRGSGLNASVANANGKGRLDTSARTNERIAYASREGEAYTLVVADAGPTANEYTAYLQNTSSTSNIHIHSVSLSATDADVKWKIHSVTGTAAGASSVTPLNTNRGSGKSASATARGGAGGVTGLTSEGVLYDFFHGPALSSFHFETHDALILGQNDAIAIEYDAGTGGAVSMTIDFHFDTESK